MKYSRIMLTVVIQAVTLLAACNFTQQSGNGATLTSITVQPGNHAMMAGTTQQYQAMGLYSDKTSRDISSTVVWNSSDPAKATFSNDQGTAGLATALDGGSVRISASLDGISSTTTLYVVSISMVPSHIVFAQTALVRLDNMDAVSTIDYRIYTKSGHQAKDVNVSISSAYMQANGLTDTSAGTMSIPIFCLYAAYTNKVAISINFKDGTVLNSLMSVQTSAYTDDRAITDIVVTQQDSNLYTNYILVNTKDSPSIIDIDGELRWQYEKRGEYIWSFYYDYDNILGGDSKGRNLYKLNLMGEMVSKLTLTNEKYSHFTHNMEFGKQGIFCTMQYRNGDAYRIGSDLLEITSNAEILNTWDFDAIVGDTITAAGEDPSRLVRNGIDWFHLNSAAYSSRDDSIIVSSRENFVLKIDYSTGQIRWIMGNPGKMWFQDYPLSLQPLALTVSGTYPIGQHAVSLLGSEELPHQYILVMNNGAGNQALPYIGDNRTYSLVSLYEINETAKTATEIWFFDDDQQIYSPACGSVYKTVTSDYLIDFATADSYSNAIIMIVDANKKMLFSMKVPKRSIDASSCDTVYNAREIKLEKFQLN